MSRDAVHENFVDVLNGLGKNGEIVYELSRRLQEVVKGVKEHEAPGSLTLKLAIAPNKKFKAVEIVPEVKASVPDKKLGATLRFINDNGVLVENDPNQLRFNFADKKEEAETEKE